MLNSNFRGVQSKVESVESIAKNVKVQVVTLNEINLRKNKKLNIDGFKAYNRNRSEGWSGKEDSEHTLNISKGIKCNEFTVKRYSQFLRSINVINVHSLVWLR